VRRRHFGWSILRALLGRAAYVTAH
jgi:hypothetical protein